MSVTTEDVAEAVKQLWTAATALSNPTTGLVKTLVYGRAPDRSQSPYATFTVRDVRTVPLAGTDYLQTFAVEIKAWSEAGAQAAGAIKIDIEAAFSIRTRTVLTLASGRTLAILHAIKQPGGLDEDTATQQSQSVKISTDRFEFLCQG